MQNDLQLIENGVFTLDLGFCKNSGVNGLENWKCSEIKWKRTP